MVEYNTWNAGESTATAAYSSYVEVLKVCV